MNTPEWAWPLDLEGEALDWLLNGRHNRESCLDAIDALTEAEAKDLLWRVCDERAAGNLRYRRDTRA